jgi:hypothetical protein
MIKLGPMKIGIRKPRSYQSHIEWGDTFVSYWPGLEQWETVQRARRVNAIHEQAAWLLFSEARSPDRLQFVIDTEACNVTAEIAEE